jgi:hypothetical protein
MMRLLAALTASLLTLAGGYVHGLWTDRWQPAVEPAVALERYNTIAMALGDWLGEPVAASTSASDAAGDLQRRYVNRKTGQVVVVALVCGRPGPVSIHTPDACYVASGFAVGEPRRTSGPDQNSEFWTTDAVRTRVTEETRLRLYWAWNAGQGWSAPDSPRQRFASFPVLHKLYVLRELAGPGETVKEEPCLAFMRVFLPELDRALFAKEAAGGPETSLAR